MGESDADRLKKAMEELLALNGIELVDEPLDEEEKEMRKGDYSEIVSKTQDKLDELNEKAELLYKRIGMTPEELETYAANPNNFTAEQWDALQKVREEAENYKRRASEVVKESEPEKKEEKKKVKKKKGRFGKKKNWIPL